MHVHVYTYSATPLKYIWISACFYACHVVSEQQLRWAKAEENPLFLCLFGRLAELNWIGNELIKQLQDKVRLLTAILLDMKSLSDVIYESMCFHSLDELCLFLTPSKLN